MSLYCGRATVKPGRLLCLDALRGLAVLLMIEQHLGVWLWEGPAPGKTPFDYPVLVTFNALGGGAAPLFIVLAGIGSTLMSSRRESPDLTLVTRGLTVMAFGYLLNFMTPSWFTWRSWFVLHLMGLGMVLTPALRRIPTGALLGLAGAVLLSTPFVQDWLDTPGSLNNRRMAGWLKGDDVVVAGSHLRIALAEGQFPILPWSALTLTGVAAGRWIVDRRERLLTLASFIALASGAGATLAWHFALRSSELTVLERAVRFNVPFFPASPAEVLILLGLVLGAIRIGLWVESRRELSPRGALVVLGRGSLTLLLLHVVLFREATRPFDLWQTLPPTTALSIMLGFIVVAAGACWLWQRTDYRFGAEWLLRKVAP